MFFADADLGQVRQPIITMIEELEGFTDNSGFSFTDKRLTKHVRAFIAALARALNISTEIMEPVGKSRYKQILPGGFFRNDSEGKKREEFVSYARKTRKAFQELLDYTRRAFPELDTTITDKIAHSRYLKS